VAAGGRRPQYAGRGRPRKDAPPRALVWQIEARGTLDPAARARAARRRAACMVGPPRLDVPAWPAAAVVARSRAHPVAARGCAVLNAPRCLAAAVVVKQPPRSLALAFLLVRGLLVDKLAELPVRPRLAATDQTVPDQVRQPTARPTRRWLVQGFAGVDLHPPRAPDGPRQTQVLPLSALHRQV
jgi:hypothetical protein